MYTYIQYKQHIFTLLKFVQSEVNANPRTTKYIFQYVLLGTGWSIYVRAKSQ